MEVVRVTRGSARPQNMAGFIGGRWSGNQQLFWMGAQPGAKLDLALQAETEGMYDLEIVLTKAPDYGIAQLSLNDARLGEPVDLYHGQGVITSPVLTHKSLPLRAGRQVLSIEIVGANPAAVQSYMVGLDYIRLVPSATKDSPAAGPAR
jgi:hypothetical protein